MRFTRREFIAGVASIAATGLPSPSLTQRRRQRPILACETYSLRDLYSSKKLLFEETPRLLKDLGIHAISLNDMFFQTWERAYLDTLKRAARDNGCEIVCLIMEGNLASNDEAERTRQIEENLRKLEAAAFLGASCVRCNLGGTGDSKTDSTVGVERCIAAFKTMLPAAKKAGIRLTIENHGGVSGRADDIIRVIEGADKRWVGSCLDFGNWPEGTWIENSARLAPFVYHVHAKTHAFRDDGEELRLDYKRLLKSLQNARFTGAISIEFEGGGDPVEGVKKTAALVRKHWKGIA